MIRLKSHFRDDLATGGVPALRTALQQAITLEHATIPAYLYALYSIKPDSNQSIQSILRSIVTEEMLHMSLACNLLVAIGGAPVIDDPGFIPRYPGRLPGSVDDGLIVPLNAFSIPLVKNVFMEIEEPEHPLNIRGEAIAAGSLTIGQLYEAIKDRIQSLGEEIFANSSVATQLVGDFGLFQVSGITDTASASQTIDLIVQQGEGTTSSPFESGNIPAHYYRFLQISKGKTIMQNPTQQVPDTKPYILGPPPIPFDATGVWPVVENPKAADYPEGSHARRACDTFNYTYTTILRNLHVTFNGQPHLAQAAIGAMADLAAQATEMMAINLDDGTHAGPSFEYQPNNPGS